MVTHGMDLYTALLVAIGQGIEQSIAQAAQYLAVALIALIVILVALTIAAHVLTGEPYIESYALREGQRQWDRMLAQDELQKPHDVYADDDVALDWQVVAIHGVRRHIFSIEYSMTVMYDRVSQAQATALAEMLNRQDSEVTYEAQQREPRGEATR